MFMRHHLCLFPSKYGLTIDTTLHPETAWEYWVYTNNPISSLLVGDKFLEAMSFNGYNNY